jgi:hypothetical protein
MDYVLIITMVPTDHLTPLLEAMGNAGAGVIGNYTHCAFTHTGLGRFKPEAGANPAIGERGQLTEVEETRIEMSCRRDRLKAVLAALRAAHPYEEPAIYLLPLLQERDE